MNIYEKGKYKYDTMVSINGQDPHRLAQYVFYMYQNQLWVRYNASFNSPYTREKVYTINNKFVKTVDDVEKLFKYVDIAPEDYHFTEKVIVINRD